MIYNSGVNKMKKFSVIGISIGGTKTAITHAFFDGNFSQIEKKTFPTNPNNPDKELNEIFKVIDALSYPVDVISLICGGPQDIENGLFVVQR